MTAVILWGRVIGGNGGQALRLGSGQAWGQENAAYSQIDNYLVSQGAAAGDVVMVANPPGFYLVSGNPAIAVPDGDVDTLLTVARRYGAHFLILENGSIPENLIPVYENPSGYPDLMYLGEIEHARIFFVQF